MAAHFSSGGLAYIDPCISQIVVAGKGSLESLGCDISHLIDANLIVSAVNLVNQHWILFPFDRINSVACNIDPLSVAFCPQLAANLGELLTDALNNALDDDVAFVENTIFDRET